MIGAFISFLGRVAGAMNSLGSLWILALMLLINLDVFSRALFNAPVDGVPEMVELSIVGIVFLQLGDAVRAGRLIRSDAIYNRLLAKRPAIGHTLGVLFDLCGAIFMGMLIYGGWPRLIEAFERNYYVGTEGIFTAPVWPVRLVLVFGCVLVALLLTARAAEHAARIADGGAKS